MNSTIIDFETGWYDLNISLTEKDIDKIIESLVRLKEDPEYHFHFFSTAFDRQVGGVSDIQFFRAPVDEKPNMDVGG